MQSHRDIGHSIRDQVHWLDQGEKAGQAFRHGIGMNRVRRRRNCDVSTHQADLLPLPNPKTANPRPISQNAPGSGTGAVAITRSSTLKKNAPVAAS